MTTTTTATTTTITTHATPLVWYLRAFECTFILKLFGGVVVVVIVVVVFVVVIVFVVSGVKNLSEVPMPRGVIFHYHAVW